MLGNCYVDYWYEGVQTIDESANLGVHEVMWTCIYIESDRDR